MKSYEGVNEKVPPKLQYYNNFSLPYNIITFRHSLAMEGYPHKEYLDLIPDEMEEFRTLFVEWVNAFDPWDFITDPWGLFNPPGISPGEEDAGHEPPMGGLD